MEKIKKKRSSNSIKISISNVIAYTYYGSTKYLKSISSKMKYFITLIIVDNILKFYIPPLM